MAEHKVCLIKECGKPAKTRGWCAAHYWRFLEHGDPLGKKVKPQRPEFCSIDGCKKPHKSGGLCAGHYLRLRRHGNPLGGGRKTMTGEPSAWLRKHIAWKSEECLTWPFAKGRDGRGRLQSDVSPQAHRAMCILAHGNPPSDIHEAAHSCGKGHEGCVNPNHLRWATPIENASDRKIHGTEVIGEKKHNSKLDDASVKMIRHMKGMCAYSKIAKLFDVNEETVGDVLRGTTWRHVNAG